MKKEYYSLLDMIQMIDLPNGNKCFNILEENIELFMKSKGSKTKHQAWKGGYLDHVIETMNIAVSMYEDLNKKRELTFSLSDSLLVLYLHDLEKPWKQNNKEYKLEKKGVKNKKKVEKFKEELISKYEVQLTPEQKNALKYIETEGNDYNSKKRVMNELAAFCHCCDVISSRVWYDEPKERCNW